MRKMIFITLFLASLVGLTVNAQEELEPTAAPVIEVVEYNDHAEFLFTCEGEIEDFNAYIYINEELVDRIQTFPWGEGAEGPTSVYWLNRTYEEQHVMIQTQARAYGKDWSSTVQFLYTFIALPISEQTAAPIIRERRDPEFFPEEIQCYNWGAIGFENIDGNDVTLYYRYHYTRDWNGTEVSSDWKSAYLSADSWGLGIIVDPELLFEESVYGWVEAYAVADFKMESEHVSLNFYFDCFPSTHFSRNYDFKVGGIYYSKLNDGTVAVTKRTIDRAAYVFNSDPYQDPENGYDDYVLDPELLYNEYANPCYYNDVIIPATVEYGGNTYTVTAIGDCAFEDCDWVTSIQLPETLTKIGACAFDGCDVPEIRIPESVTEIGTGAFRSCLGLTSITIPDAVTSISKKMFQWCYNLSEINLPDGVTTIGEEAFKYCSGLTDVVIPEAVTLVGAEAFSWCDNLVSVEIPAAVEEIEPRAFEGCSALMKVTCRGFVPPFSLNAFYYGENDQSWLIYDQATLFVPNEALEDYRTTDEWCNFSRIVPFLGAGPGDVNGDGKLSITDVTGVIGELLSGGEDQPAYCDVNGDGRVTITDVTALIEMLLNGN